jgi:hypothetical protein
MRKSQGMGSKTNYWANHEGSYSGGGFRGSGPLPSGRLNSPLMTLEMVCGGMFWSYKPPMSRTWSGVNWLPDGVRPCSMVAITEAGTGDTVDRFPFGDSPPEDRSVELEFECEGCGPPPPLGVKRFNDAVGAVVTSRECPGVSGSLARDRSVTTP